MDDLLGYASLLRAAVRHFGDDLEGLSGFVALVEAPNTYLADPLVWFSC